MGIGITCNGNTILFGLECFLSMQTFSIKISNTPFMGLLLFVAHDIAETVHNTYNAVSNLYTNRKIHEHRWNTHLNFYVTQEVFCNGEIRLHVKLSTVQVNFQCISSRIYTMHINVSTTVAEFVGRHNNNALMYLVGATIMCLKNFSICEDLP